MEQLGRCGIEVSLFIDPDTRQIEMAHLLGARAVEIQTARYSEARTAADRQRELDSLRDAAEVARQLGLHVHLGHGLQQGDHQPDRESGDEQRATELHDDPERFA